MSFREADYTSLEAHVLQQAIGHIHTSDWVVVPNALLQV